MSDRHRQDELYSPSSATSRLLGSDSLEEPLLARAENGSGQPSQKATAVHSIFNVVNLFMGVGLLSLPYAMRLGGWAAVPALFLMTLLFAYSGHMIVDGFQKVESETHSYAMLGQQAFGISGRRAVVLCTVLDMFGGCTVCLIMSCKQIEGLILPNEGVWGLSPSQLAMTIGITAAACSAFISSFRQLAFMSMLGVTCSLTVTLAVVLSPLLDLSREYPAATHGQVPPSHSMGEASVMRSIGIFALSMAGHAALPSFRNRYWGDSVSEIVMKDIALSSPFRDLFGVREVMTAMICLNAFSKVPIILMVLQDMLVSNMYEAPQYPPPRLGLYIKLGIWMLVAIVAVAAYDVLGTVMSLLGGLTSINASVAFPALFYLKLYWHELGPWRRIRVAAIIVLSIALSVLIISENVISLVHRATHPGNSMLQYLPGNVFSIRAFY